MLSCVICSPCLIPREVPIGCPNQYKLARVNVWLQTGDLVELHFDLDQRLVRQQQFEAGRRLALNHSDVVALDRQRLRTHSTKLRCFDA